MTLDTADQVLVERDGAVAVVVLNRPTRRNALTLAVMDTLRGIFADLATSDAGAVVIRGAGGFFCSGLDVREIDPSVMSLSSWSAVHFAMSDLEIPVVACLEGGAINAGAALALACDLVVAGENAYIQMMEASMGVTPPMNAAWLALRYPAVVGMQLALSCRPFKGPDLSRLGVALDVVPDNEVLPHTLRLAAEIAAYPGAAGRSTKRVLRLARDEADRFSSAVSAAAGTADAAPAGDRP